MKLIVTLGDNALSALDSLMQKHAVDSRQEMVRLLIHLAVSGASGAKGISGSETVKREPRKPIALRRLERMREIAQLPDAELAALIKDSGYLKGAASNPVNADKVYCIVHTTANARVVEIIDELEGGSDDQKMPLGMLLDEMLKKGFIVA